MSIWDQARLLGSENVDYVLLVAPLCNIVFRFGDGVEDAPCCVGTRVVSKLLRLLLRTRNISMRETTESPFSAGLL